MSQIFQTKFLTFVSASVGAPNALLKRVGFTSSSCTGIGGGIPLFRVGSGGGVSCGLKLVTFRSC